jgi:hypothetical protein
MENFITKKTVHFILFCGEITFFQIEATFEFMQVFICQIIEKDNVRNIEKYFFDLTLSQMGCLKS